MKKARFMALRQALGHPGHRRGMVFGLVLAGAVTLLPAATGAFRPTVVGRRNPLWQLAVSAAVRVLSGCLVVLPVALAAGRRRRESQLSGA